MVGRIAVGEVADTKSGPKSAAAEMGSKGGAARAAKMSHKERSAAARKAAKARWKLKLTS